MTRMNALSSGSLAAIAMVAESFTSVAPSSGVGIIKWTIGGVGVWEVVKKRWSVVTTSPSSSVASTV